MSIQFAAEPERLSPPARLPVAGSLLAPAPAAAPEPVLAAPQPADAPAEAVAPPASGPIEATQFFAGRVLAEERDIAAALPTLGNDERVVQLCNIEGLEQIRAARPDFAPDTLVAYAFAGMLVRRNRLTAPGAAFRSRGRWWALSLDCTVAPDFSTVTAFTFTPGEEIPEAEWEEHYLTAVEDEE